MTSLFFVIHRALHGSFFLLLQYVQRHQILTQDPSSFRLFDEYRYLLRINSLPPQRLLKKCNFPERDTEYFLYL